MTGHTHGGREIERVPVAGLAHGAEVSLWMHRLRGRRGDGPTVGLCAAIHGNEPVGTEILLEVARRVQPADLHGDLLLLPVANPLAFEANSRHTPVDDLNLNRLFPGVAGGWFSEQLAFAITQHFLTKIDVLIDLHSGGDRPTVDYVYIRNAEQLSRAFGSRVLYRADPAKAGTLFQGTSVSVTEARGLPSVTVELGGGQIDQRPYVERGVAGIRNMLGVLGVLEGAAAPASALAPPGEQVVVDSITTIRPTQGGWLETAAPPLGETVPQGAILGRVVSPYTFEVLEEIRNTVDHGIMILSHLTRTIVQPGDYGYMVGEIAAR